MPREREKKKKKRKGRTGSARQLTVSCRNPKLFSKIRLPVFVYHVWYPRNLAAFALPAVADPRDSGYSIFIDSTRSISLRNLSTVHASTRNNQSIDL